MLVLHLVRAASGRILAQIIEKCILVNVVIGPVTSAELVPVVVSRSLLGLRNQATELIILNELLEIEIPVDGELVLGQTIVEAALFGRFSKDLGLVDASELAVSKIITETTVG